MSLVDMIEQAAGGGALQQIGARVGLDPNQLNSVLGSLAPALGPKLAEHAATGGLEGTPTGSDAPVPGSDEAEAHGNSVLGSIFGSLEGSNAAAANASAETGVGAEKIRSLLPQLASVAAVALASHQGGQSGGAFGGLLDTLGQR